MTPAGTPSANGNIPSALMVCCFSTVNRIGGLAVTVRLRVSVTATYSTRGPLLTACMGQASVADPLAGKTSRNWLRRVDQSSGSTYVPGSLLRTLR